MNAFRNTRRIRRRAGATPRRRPPRWGFTLAELMISIGVLGIGLSMAAALFPMGLKENENSIRYMQAGMMLENGLAVAKAYFKVNNVTLTNFDVTSQQIIHEWGGENTKMNWQHQHFPNGVDSRRGFVAIARKVDDASSANFQIAVVAYTKIRGGGATNKVAASENRVELRAIAYTVVGTNPPKVTGTGLIAGSPLIDAQTGLYATIISSDTSDANANALLDHALNVPSGTPRTGLVVVENVPTGAPTLTVSPAIGTIVSNAVLRP